jgi:hypothetical protein
MAATSGMKSRGPSRSRRHAFPRSSRPLFRADHHWGEDAPARRGDQDVAEQPLCFGTALLCDQLQVPDDRLLTIEIRGCTCAEGYTYPAWTHQVLKAEDRAEFIVYARKEPTHFISIHWSLRDDEGQTWHIVPRTILKVIAYRFRSRERIGTWILKSESALAAYSK